MDSVVTFEVSVQCQLDVEHVSDPRRIKHIHTYTHTSARGTNYFSHLGADMSAQIGGGGREGAPLTMTPIAPTLVCVHDRRPTTPPLLLLTSSHAPILFDKDDDADTVAPTAHACCRCRVRVWG